MSGSSFSGANLCPGGSSHSGKGVTSTSEELQFCSTVTGVALQLDLVYEVLELRLGQPTFLLANEVWKTMIPLFTHLIHKWEKKGTNFASYKENSTLRTVVKIRRSWSLKK